MRNRSENIGQLSDNLEAHYVWLGFQVGQQKELIAKGKNDSSQENISIVVVRISAFTKSVKTPNKLVMSENKFDS